MFRLAVAFGAVAFASAVNFGNFTDTAHPFAGALASPALDVPCIFNRCGATLIDVGDLFSCKEQVQRRIVITAGHCINASNDFSQRPAFISFNATPRANYSACGPGGLFFKNRPSCRGSNAWTNLILTDSTKIIPSVTANDFAIILLDEEVPYDAIPDPLPVLASYNPPEPYLQPGSDRISRLGVAGYGIAGMGMDGIPLGKPEFILTPPVRQYVELDVLTVQETSVEVLGVAALEEGTLCRGDSGSGLFTTEPNADGQYTLVSVVSNAPKTCRSITRTIRLDTTNFRDFIASIDCYVCQKAGAPVTCRDNGAARTADLPSPHSASTPLALILGIGFSAGVGLLLMVAVVAARRNRRPTPLPEELGL